MENEKVMDFSEDEDVDALAEGGFADIIGTINSRLHAMEAITGDNWVTGALAASDAAGGVFTWQNTTGHAVEVTRVLIKVTTQSTGACTADTGGSATVASADNLIDGLSLAATGLFDNITDKGTNGKSKVTVANNQYVTASMASGATAGLVGRYALQIVNVG